jgi:succinate--hydroxymethylglutarate CoA-transferase
MHLTGDKETAPYKMGFAISDVLTGLHASNAILGGLHYVNANKKGIHIQTSLIESSVASLVNQASNYLNGGTSPHRIGNNHPNIVPYGVFKCFDKYITIAGGTDKQYEILCRVLGL